METYSRICVKDFEITAKNGDHFEVKRGKESTTSPSVKDGKVVVFRNF